MQSTAENLLTHIRVLTRDIGVRLAGSSEERRAAEYIAGEFRNYSAQTTIEEYPINERYVPSEKLEVQFGGKWHEFPASLFGCSTGTDGKTVKADIVWFNSETDYQRKDISFITGKAVIHLSSHIESEQNYRRLMEARPAFIIFVDTRYTGTTYLSDGLFPKYVAKYGTVPSLGIAYFDAWKFRRENAAKARIRITGGMRPSTTTVVVCELPGTDPKAGVLYAGGHHDSQAATVGADDNACGSAAVIELARLLSARKHKRTIRLISFGGEEQLSVGSAAYVRAHQKDIRKNGLFMCNFDSFGSALGWFQFLVNGRAPLRKLIKNEFNSADIYYKEITDICPYTDQFPFAACGVPGIWITRYNCDMGYYYHHRNDNVLENLDGDVMASAVECSAKILARLADADTLTGLTGIPDTLQRKIDALFTENFGDL